MMGRELFVHYAKSPGSGEQDVIGTAGGRRARLELHIAAGGRGDDGLRAESARAVQRRRARELPVHPCRRRRRHDDQVWHPGLSAAAAHGARDPKRGGHLRHFLRGSADPSSSAGSLRYEDQQAAHLRLRRRHGRAGDLCPQPRARRRSVRLRRSRTAVESDILQRRRHRVPLRRRRQPDANRYGVGDAHRTAGLPGAVAATATALAASTAAAPAAVNDSYGIELPSGAGAQTLSMSVRNNDTDPDGDTLVITAVSDPAGVPATSILGSGNGTYIQATGIPVGTTTFTYTISDGHGHVDTATVTIERTVEYTPPPCPPYCEP